MLEENTKQVNRILSKNLLWCTVLLIILLIINFFGVFSFKGSLVFTIIGAGFIATCVPHILVLMNVSDTFIKYYIHISISLMICLLGMNNGIGVYITFIIVPVISCLYFDRHFTLKVSAFSYLTMAISVYVNCAHKLEITMYDWSQQYTFILYMIGFTIEYIVVLLFLYQIVHRAQTFFLLQQENVSVLQREKERRKQMNELYRDSIPKQRKTAYSMLYDEANYFNAEDIARLSSGQQFTVQLQDVFNMNNVFCDSMMKDFETIGDYFKVDRIFCVEVFREEERGKITYQWARNQEDTITSFPTYMSSEDYEIIGKEYDKKGYMEYVLSENLNSQKPKEPVSELGKGLYGKCLGAQLWIPLVDGGIYSGAICFDRHERKGYSTVDKILLTEIVGILANNLFRVNANNANKAKSAFLSTMSHEIRTPMNAIIGMTQVALREETNDIVKNSLQVIRSSGEGLLALINDILDFSKIESGRIDIVPEDYEIMSIISDLRTLVNTRNAEKGLKVNYEIAEDLPSVLHGDAVRIKQAMVNLGTNAIKYTDEGSVTISVSMKKKNDVGVLHFEVKDTGQGIKEEDMEKLFKSFSQVNVEQNHHKEGTGLGLAITKQLIELMNGHVSVQSEYKKGSVFTFEVPQGIVDSTPAGKLDDYKYKEKKEELSFKAPDAEVLIVDDNEVNLTVAGFLFKPFEFKMDKARNGKEALEMSLKKKYDLILMDHYMPVMDGEESTKHIREDKNNPNNETPIIALTADAVTGAKEKMLASGMNDYLDKPIVIEKAEKMFKRYLEK